jgi:hypothetical protein
MMQVTCTWLPIYHAKRCLEGEQSATSPLPAVKLYTKRVVTCLSIHILLWWMSICFLSTWGCTLHWRMVQWTCARSLQTVSLLCTRDWWPWLLGLFDLSPQHYFLPEFKSDQHASEIFDRLRKSIGKMSPAFKATPPRHIPAVVYRCR